MFDTDLIADLAAMARHYSFVTDARSAALYVLGAYMSQRFGINSDADAEAVMECARACYTAFVEADQRLIDAGF